MQRFTPSLPKWVSPDAPPVYRPTPVAVQPKPLTPLVPKQTSPGAPPVYRSVQAALQPKILAGSKEALPQPAAISRPASTATPAKLPHLIHPAKASSVRPSPSLPQHHSVQRATSRPPAPSRSHDNTVQRLALRTGLDGQTGLVSRFDRAKLVTNTQSVLTIRSGASTFDGGHATVYLEYLDAKGEGVMREVDLTTDGTQVFFNDRIAATEYKPSNMLTKLLFSRSITDHDTPVTTTGQLGCFSISQSQLQAAFRKIAELNAQNRRGELEYSYTQGHLRTWTQGWVTGKTYMNCSDYASQIAVAAGQPVSSGVLNLPKAASTPDTRSKEQIYYDAKAAHNV